jgi:DNA primase
MMTVEKRKHTKRTLNKDMFDELVGNEVNGLIGEEKKELNLSEELKDILEEPDQENFDLNSVVEYYHSSLFGNDKALNYLKNIGLKKPENITRFKVGFADGTLKEKLSKKQTDFFIEKGILNKEKEESLFNCIIFPVFFEETKLIAFYGINIETNEKISLYFDDRIPLFNEKVTKIYDEVILTNSIIDGLSLIELGIQNVVAFGDTAHFTESQIKVLQSNRVKTVILAFDNELDNLSAGEFLRKFLLNEGFKVKEVFLPKSYNSWNEALQKGIYKAEILQLINQTALLKPAEGKETFRVQKDNFKYIFTIADIDYTVTGVKDIFVSNLRINVKAEYQGEWFPDNLDLYSARSRTSFSSNISQKFGVEITRIEKDLLKILEYLEKERDKALTGKEETEVELTEEERQIGLTFLKSPDLFDQVVKDMEILGYVGEDLNKQLLYICASTRKLDDPISVLIISQSASGKSYLVDTVKMLLPESEVIAITSLSDQALNYIPDGGLVHKFLTLGEAVHSEVIEHNIREMLSGKELTRLVTTKDEKTGQLLSKQVKTKVVVASVMSTTNHRINPENASRYFLINADESKEQTRKIHEAQRNKYSLERYYEKKEKIPEVIKKHKSAQRLLRNIIIVNPFAKHLDFPDATMRTRRDNERFLDLIAGVCFLRQYQKKVKDDGNLEFIECDLTDYETAYNIMVNGVLSSTLVELPGGAVLLYEEIRNMVKNMAKEKNLQPEEVSFIQREIREQTKLGGEFIKKHLRILVEYEYLNFTSGKNKGTRYSYQLRKDEEIKNIDLNVIPTPESMRKKLKKL